MCFLPVHPKYLIIRLGVPALSSNRAEAADGRFGVMTSLLVPIASLRAEESGAVDLGCTYVVSRTSQKYGKSNTELFTRFETLCVFTLDTFHTYGTKYALYVLSVRKTHL